MLGNICIANVCKPRYDVMNFEVNLIFLIKPFFLHEKKSWQRLKYLENKKSFSKSIFHHFWRAFNQANNTIILEVKGPT